MSLKADVSFETLSSGQFLVPVLLIINSIDKTKLSCLNVYLFIFTETTTVSPYMYLMLDIPPSPLYKVLNCFYHNPHCYGFLFFNKDTILKKK